MERDFLYGGIVMEPILAKQSVDIKCRLCASIMMGNYEFYYAAGRFFKMAAQKPELSLQPKELHAFLRPLLDTYETKNEQEAYLVKMLKDYEASDEYDMQMKELLQMGLLDDER